MSVNLAGALLMMASMACFVLNDTLLKMTGGAVPLFQLLFVRSVITCGLIFATKGRLGALHFAIKRRDWVIMLVRAVTEVTISYFFLTALFNMPLANLTAILQGVPLAVTLASAVILREAVGWRRSLAIAVGFCGVLLIVRPGAEGFNIWSIYAVIAMLGVTLRDLVTRQLSPDVPSMTVTLVTAVTVMVGAGLASLSTPWVPIAGASWALIVASAFCILGGYYFSIQVMRSGDVSFTAPFRYSGLVWALILGWFVFGEWPHVLTLIGAAIVVGTGVFSFYRERRVSGIR
ncbi:DMT family transporter [Sulfitobacter sp. M57]|uniref:DMT family transporter n=1 Tax=unclassified Sulfitobacter TaxID=196795 RepID=UPI0023E205C9|nr:MULTISPECIES: DMT family transporter [unclassified Sulfitobacter]MDF3416002.1 DMT family transporter [Sulfitobacter sp. KE5]MDF3423482.1 DMT family transporter [Sulfitobacter sp. KE43]MDF3434548.1 DMT family transporter [Sulfitobacter sp. KE42]MDF3460188.1 DMT family transporter [Sulfitobacter sp. S74]MDF3464086.1 DMT family transporter [Sulfitobacter sp. Ks18]